MQLPHDPCGRLQRFLLHRLKHFRCLVVRISVCMLRSYLCDDYYEAILVFTGHMEHSFGLYPIGLVLGGTVQKGNGSFRFVDSVQWINSEETGI